MCKLLGLKMAVVTIIAFLQIAINTVTTDNIHLLAYNMAAYFIKARKENNLLAKGNLQSLVI